MRFFMPMKQLSHAMAAQLTQIDYDREMAFVLADPAAAGRAEIHGVAGSPPIRMGKRPSSPSSWPTP